jgi:GH25 family lysozyme M1 (1,4-beta-N-acetylmuramidase)
VEYNDGNQFHVVTDPYAYMASREMFEFRACSAKTVNSAMQMYVDATFLAHRAELSGMLGLLMYQFVYPDFTPEDQANYFCDTIGTLRSNEMVMCDLEAAGTGFVLSGVVDFLNRWLAVVESRLGTLAWVYVPQAFSGVVTRKVTGNRIVKAPRYGTDTGVAQSPPNWDYDVWQYSTKGAFPGGTPATGDINTTGWSLRQLLARCAGDVSPIPTARRERTSPIQAGVA